MMHENRAALWAMQGVNLVVEAGAGTGKTHSLIRRLCVCILLHQIPVEKLVALTFTEKAAAEIKTRLIVQLQNLVRYIQGDKPAKGDKRGEHVWKDTQKFLEFIHENFKINEEELMARAEKSLLRLDRVSIGTIHGFCAEILKAFPLEAGLAPNVLIDDGSQGGSLFDARWNHFLDAELGVNAPRKEVWKSVLEGVSLDDLKAFAQELCRGKIEKYDYFAHRSMLCSVCHTKQVRAEELSRLYLEGKTKPRLIENTLKRVSASLARTEAFLRDETVAPETMVVPIKVPTKPANWEDEDYEEAISLYQFAIKTTPEKQRIFLQAYELVSPVCAQVRQDYQEAGLVGFDDLIVKTRNLLRDNLYVRRLLKEKFDALLIDEFQDTDPVQGELLLFLAEEKPGAASRWQDVKLLSGKLFIVGDPKQSIYRFRGADITAYELFTDLILRQGGKKFFLQCNFRSTPEIIAMANGVCSRAMVQQSTFQPAYVPIFTPAPVSPASVEWLFITAGPEPLKADDFRHNQAEQIAQWIINNVGKMELPDGEKLTYKDIALLFKARTQIPFYTDAFRRYGIAFNVDVDKDFFRKQEINDFLNFLQAVSDSSNRIALAGVLRSPLVGMSDEELYELAQRGELFFAAPTQNPKARYGYELIGKYRALAGRVSVKELVRRILEETFLPEVCAVAYDGARSVTYLEQLVKWIDTYHTQETEDAASFFMRLQQNLQENPESIHASNTEEALNAVSILTVHKSKGLEFPVVILADLTRQETVPSSDRAHIFSWQYNMHGLRVGKIVDINLAFLEEEQKKHSQCEEVRLLYVSLTRAKRKLILVGDERQRAEKSTFPFKQAGLFPDGKTKPACLVDGDLTVPVQYADGVWPESFKYRMHKKEEVSSLDSHLLTKWKKSCEARTQRYETLQKQTALAPSELEEALFLSPAQQQAAELGTVCHKVLELLVSKKETSLPNAVKKAAQLQSAAARGKEAEELLAPFVQSALFKEISSCELLSCELPFSCLTGDGAVVSGLMDALLRRPDGTLWVIDYKTDRIAAGKEKERLKEKYEGQLRAYKTAVEKLFPGEKVTASAVFVRTFAVADLEKLQ